MVNANTDHDFFLLAAVKLAASSADFINLFCDDCQLTHA